MKNKRSLITLLIVSLFSVACSNTDSATSTQQKTSELIEPLADKELSVDKEPLAQKKLLQVVSINSSITVNPGTESERLVPLLISYPKGQSYYPLIVFSHGHYLTNQSYRNLTDHWVAHGYIVVAPLHIDTGDMAIVAALSEKVGRDWVAASRAIELNSVINQIGSVMQSIDDFKGSVSTERVIAAGHSFGALSSQHLAGATLELQNDSIYPVPDNLEDDRVVAVVAISPPGPMAELLTEKTWQNFSAPQLVVTGPNDFFPQVWPDYTAHFLSYETAKEGDNYLLVLDEMDHYLGNLIGRLERPGPPQDIALQNLQEISLLFIESYLDDENESINNLTEISQRKGVLGFEHR